MAQLDAASNPDMANQILQKALAGDFGDVPMPEPDLTPATHDLPETSVTLPCGYITNSGDLITEVEVRELNGFDEEALSKVRGQAKTMDVLLERGVVQVGALKPNKEIFKRMLVADREAVLLGIRKATYGTELELHGLGCPHCSQYVDVQIDLDADVDTKYLESPEDRHFHVKLAKGQAHVSLPSGQAQSAALSADGKTSSELTTILLSHCVNSINDFPINGEADVQRLSMRDRKKIVKELGDRQVGPMLGEVKKPCPSCEEDIRVPISLMELFLG